MAEFHRAANTIGSRARINLTIEQSSWDRATSMAQACRVSRSQLVQWLIDTVQLGPDGLPVGWPESPKGDEELPMAG